MKLNKESVRELPGAEVSEKEKNLPGITGKKHVTVKDITLIGMMVAVIEVCKMLMTFLPNIELTSFWVIMFTIFFGWKMIFVIPVFILIEAFIYPFGMWLIMYIYAWPLLALVVWIFRKKDSIWFFSILSALFGLLFGLLCAIPYIFVYAGNGAGLAAGLSGAFAWWIAGIPWDITHGIANFVLMLVLYYPVRRIMDRVCKI